MFPYCFNLQQFDSSSELSPQSLMWSHFWFCDMHRQLLHWNWFSAIQGMQAAIQSKPLAKDKYSSQHGLNDWCSYANVWNYEMANALGCIMLRMEGMRWK